MISLHSAILFALHLQETDDSCTLRTVIVENSFIYSQVEILDDRCVQDTVWNDDSYCVYNSKVCKCIIPQRIFSIGCKVSWCHVCLCIV
jgi:hypothetical protein